MDVAGEKLNSGQQTADAAHVSVAITSDAVANSFEDQHFIPVVCKWLHRLFEDESGSGHIWPKGAGDDSVRTEKNNQALLAERSWVTESEAGQTHEERHCRRAYPEGSQKISSC